MLPEDSSKNDGNKDLLFEKAWNRLIILQGRLEAGIITDSERDELERLQPQVCRLREETLARNFR